MYCRKCGTELPANADFCNKCGTKTISLTSPKPEERVSNKKNIIPKIKRKTVISIFVIFIFLGIIAYGTFYFIEKGRVAIGDTYQGGIVVYVLQPGDSGYNKFVQHGLIAAPVDQSAGIVWSKPNYQLEDVPKGTSTAMGSGSTNTDNIISQNIVGTGCAAGVARAYRGGGYSDWYLPSFDELERFYIMNNLGLGNFSSDFYWSSSEYWSSFENDCSSVHVLNLKTGYNNIKDKTKYGDIGKSLGRNIYKDYIGFKFDGTINVRAVRSF